MYKLLVSGYYGFNNIGDEAILKGLIDGIKEEDENINITVLSKYPSFTMKKHKVKAINRMNIFKIIKELIDTDVFISGGGSLLQDITSKRSIIYYMSLIFLAKLMNKKTMIYSQGIGPINKNFNKKLLKFLLNKVDIINVRDYKSKEFILKELKLDKDVLVTVDTVFKMKKPSLKIGKKILSNLNIDKNKKSIGISIRPWMNNNLIIEEICKFCVEINKNLDYNIVFIPYHYYADLSIIDEVVKKLDLETKESIYFLREYMYVDEYLSIVGNLDYFVGMRLHSLIFASIMKVPSIAISYDPKIDSFMKSLDKTASCDTDNIDSKKLLKDLKYIIKNTDDEIDLLSKKTDEFSNKAKTHNKALLNLLKNK
ncbi:MAG: polysaccharide pyruvyl transferase CsaB [Peptostreptococcaceae bacterium]|nr:polysaccharide pyruvyl transferase CsaB [Peptostreptococcaceae bacterium]